MQSTPDRDNYVKINEKNIKKKYKHNFRKYNASRVTNLNQTYDYHSIMHYSARAFSVDQEKLTIEPLVSYKFLNNFSNRN